MNRGWQGLDELTNSFTARILSIDWELGWKEKKKEKTSSFLLAKQYVIPGGGTPVPASTSNILCHFL